MVNSKSTTPYMEQSSTDINKNFYAENRVALWMILIGTLMLLLVSQARGLSCTDDICINPILYNTTCCVVTPEISCAIYDYQLFTNAGELIETGNLSVYNDTLTSYFFNFQKDVGTYYVKICDGSTKQLIVQGDNMIALTPNTWLLITLIGLFILFLFLAFKIHPLFLVLDGLIFEYFAYYSYTLYQSWFITVIVGMVGLILLFIGVIGAMYHE